MTTSPSRPFAAERRLNIGLWVLQVLLSLFSLSAGYNHGIRPLDEAMVTGDLDLGGLARPGPVHRVRRARRGRRPGFPARDGHSSLADIAGRGGSGADHGAGHPVSRDAR